jgi:hypothetical protein
LFAYALPPYSYLSTRYSYFILGFRFVKNAFSSPFYQRSPAFIGGQPIFPGHNSREIVENTSISLPLKYLPSYTYPQNPLARTRCLVNFEP